MCDNELNLNINQYKKLKKIYKSASLTFYSKELGYLICEEFRYKEKKILLHTIGGKVEYYDNDIFSTAIREFIEETNLEAHIIINDLSKNKNDLILMLHDFLEKTSYFIDICVNKEYNYYHRYFMVLLDDIKHNKIKESIILLPNYFNGNFKTEINKIIWYSLNDKESYKKENISWLTKMFFKFFI